VLTVTVPDQKEGLGPVVPKPPDSAEAQQNQQALQMMKVMMKGLFVDVSLNVDGRIVKTNAPHVSGSTVTLLQVDFDKLLADEATLQRLQGATDIKALANVPGLKVITERTLNVEFVK
jgi:hypothetical protein